MKEHESPLNLRRGQLQFVKFLFFIFFLRQRPHFIEMELLTTQMQVIFTAG